MMPGLFIVSRVKKWKPLLNGYKSREEQHYLTMQACPQRRGNRINIVSYAKKV